MGAYLPPAGCAERHLAPASRSAQGLTPAARLPVSVPAAQAPQSQPILHGSLFALAPQKKGGLSGLGLPSDYLAPKYLPEFLQLLPVDTGSLSGIFFFVLHFLFLPQPLPPPPPGSPRSICPS